MTVREPVVWLEAFSVGLFSFSGEEFSSRLQKEGVERGSVSYCFELSASALSSTPASVFHFTYFRYTHPFAYAFHLVVSHYFFQIKMFLPSTCGRQ